MKKSQIQPRKTKNVTKTLYMLLGAFCFSNQTVAATVTPHRAFYEMQLGVADQNSSVQAVSGRSAFTLDRECDGWRSNEEYLIEFGGKEGSRDRILSRFESWESDNGDLYSFEISEKSSFESAIDFGGFAEIKSGGGDAYFSMADEVTVALPADTYFPMRHLNAIIDSAKNGKTMLAASVFTGAKPDDALLSTNTVIGGWRGEKAAVQLGKFGQDGYWPVQIAYFKPAATAAAPEYEIQFSMQPNGVIRRYVIDYGEFTIIAELLKLESVEMPNCS
ncbi:cell envelope integrity EipB family protein [Alphaproteobacteria bacterium]|nr:cell envelope integrity EipB family protein [Alphaproteobacteria bacterium]